MSSFQAVTCSRLTPTSPTIWSRLSLNRLPIVTAAVPTPTMGSVSPMVSVRPADDRREPALFSWPSTSFSARDRPLTSASMNATSRPISVAICLVPAHDPAARCQRDRLQHHQLPRRRLRPARPLPVPLQGREEVLPPALARAPPQADVDQGRGHHAGAPV